MKATREQFAKLWSELGLGLMVEPAYTFGLLESAYGHEARRYHTLEHIGWGLKRIDEMEEEDRTRGSKFVARDWDTIRWAFWFHDYASEGSPEDEATSANIAMRCAEEAGLTQQFQDDVKRLVLATSHSRIPLRHDEARICDVDLSILGAPEEAFWNYERLVRSEWAHVPEELYRVARAVILKRFVDRPWIYMTDFGRTRWERRARLNLAASLQRLGAAPPPGWAPGEIVR